MLEQYLLKHVSNRNEAILQIENIAKNERVPIMDPVSVHFLMQLIRIKKPKKILEIGTAIGYSALRMNEAYPEAAITTIERDEKMYKMATEHINQFNRTDKIHLIYGDALTVLNDFCEQKNSPVFDLVFIDAAKAQYKRFFNLVRPLLAKDGIIVTDNVLFKGYVYNDEHAPKRLKKLAHKIDQYNEWLMQLNDFSTSIIPIGDGVAISVRI